MPRPRGTGALAGAVCVLLGIVAVAGAAEILARLHRAEVIEDIVGDRGGTEYSIVTADGWVVGTDAVVTVCGIVGAVAVAAWLVVARVDAGALRLPRADGRRWLFGAWLLVVAAAAATEVAVGGGFSWESRQAMSSTGLADLRKVRDHDNSTVVPTLAWIGACGATITLVSLVTRRHAERERELWVEAVYARAASDDAADGPPEPPAGTRESTTPPAPGGDR